MKKSVFLPRHSDTHYMAVVAQLVRVPDCGSVGRRFESDLPPETMSNSDLRCKPLFFLCQGYPSPKPRHCIHTPPQMRRTCVAPSKSFSDSAPTVLRQ